MPHRFLATAKHEAAERYAACGEEWIARFNVEIRKARKTLTGVAWVADRQIEAPWPATTRARLYIVAHEIGHIALDHRGRLPRYVQEFEAEQFAHRLMRQSGLSVPRKMTERAKRYIRRKIDQAFVRGVLWIDPDIAKWANENVSGINIDPSRRKPYHANSIKRVKAAL